MKIESFITHPDMPVSQDLVYNFICFLCNELDVTPKKISVASYEVADGILGMCLDDTDDSFVILVNEKERSLTEVFVTIAHEMVHVKQYMKEKLGWFLDNRSHIPYHDRWWEKEAFSLQYNLVEKFAGTIK